MDAESKETRRLAIETKTQIKLFKKTATFRKWKHVFDVQQMRREKIPWEEIQQKLHVSKATVQRAQRAVIPEDILNLIVNPECTAPTQEVAARKVKTTVNCNLNELEFVEDKDHLNFSLFPMQRVIIKCFYGLPLDTEKKWVEFGGKTEQEMVEDLVAKGRCTWKGQQRYRELVLVVGMKGGKTALAGVLAAIEEYSLYKLPDFREHYGLPKGKQVLILNVAANEDQAKKTIFSEISALVRNAPYFQRRPAPDENSTTFDFMDTNVLIQSGHSNSNALVGPLSKCVLLDELDRFSAKTDGKSSGKHMYNSVSRNVAPFKMEGKIICISSPMSVAGPIIHNFNMSKVEPTMLGFWLPTWELNPNLPFDSEVMQAELRKSPEDFWRDYGAAPSQSLEKYYRDRDKIDEIFKRGDKLGLRNPIRKDGSFEDWFRGNANYNYHLHMDPSVKNDCFGIAMAHREGAYVKLDLMHKFKPEQGEIDYARVSEFLSDLVSRFPTLVSSTYDVYLAVSLNQALQDKGVAVDFLRIDKAQHDKMKIETVYNGRLACYPCLDFRRELRDLDLISGTKVDHPRENEEGGRGSKDMSDAAAGAVYACVMEGEFSDAPAVSFESAAMPEEGAEFSRQPGSMFGNMGGASMFGGPGMSERGNGGGLIW